MQSLPDRHYVIGTRGSPLALYQANLVQSLLADAHSYPTSYFPIKIFKTTGDRLRGELTQFGGKGLFTKELEVALQEGVIDMAVHSMKDVPTMGQEDLIIAAVLPREDPRDAFISQTVPRLMDLPQGAVVGTASIRRRAQLSALRPDIQFTLLRGNVGTRLTKLSRGDCAATFLACAGLKRLGQEDVITEAISTERMLPAPAQGAIGVEIRREDSVMRAALMPLDHTVTHMAIAAERAFLRALDGSCRTPISALAEWDGNTLNFRGAVFSKDGTMRFDTHSEMPCKDFDDASAFGMSLGLDLRDKIGDRVLWDDE